MAKVTRQTVKKKVAKKGDKISIGGRKKASRKKGTASKPKAGKISNRPLDLILYGPPGVGKTSFAAGFPNVGFIADNQEEGILDLQAFNQIENPIPNDRIAVVDTWDELLNALDECVKWGIETLAIDSLTGIQKLCFIAHCAEHFNDDWSKEGFYSYYSGPEQASTLDWPKFIDAVAHVRKSGINTIMIAHSQVKEYNNPEGPNYDQYIPWLDKRIWANTHRTAQAVLFYNYRLEVRKEGTKNKADVDQSEGRIICTTRSPAYEAKNRLGLSPVIDAGESGTEAFEAFVKDLHRNL